MRIRHAAIVVTICSLFLLGAQKPPGGKPDEPTQPTNNRKEENKSEGLTKVEKEVIRRARGPNATTEDKARADDICKKKCQACFDGQHCDLECVEKNC